MQFHFHFYFVPTTTPVVNNDSSQAGGSDYINNEQMFNQFLAQMFANHVHQSNANRKRATKKSILDQLPVYTCDSNDSYQSQFHDCQCECSICLCDSENDERLLRLPCMHTFHESCINPWLTSNHSCPVCRYELPIETVYDNDQQQQQQQNSDINVQMMKMHNRLDEEQNKEIMDRMTREYGPESIQLMNIGSHIQNQYSHIQKLMFQDQCEKSCIGKESNDLQYRLNSIEVELNQSMYKLDSIIVPSSTIANEENESNEMKDVEQEQNSSSQSTKYTWNHSKIRQVRRQFVHRIQALLLRIDQMRQQSAAETMTMTMTD